MKKYKVEIPKGYDVDYEQNDTDTYCKKRIIIYLKPIKKELPKTWEEYFRKNGDKTFGCKVFIPNQYNEPIKALVKLLELRDHYNDGWMPDWIDIKIDKWCIRMVGNEMHIIDFASSARVLSFKSESLANEFLSNFRELINEAKPLL